jgi:hypothetical protein
MHTITPHIVVCDAAGAADWYKRVLGAEELGRIEVPERGPQWAGLAFWLYLTRGWVEDGCRPVASYENRDASPAPT